MIDVRPCLRSDAEFVGAHLRAEDAEECRAASGLEPLPCTLRAFDSSRECYAIYVGRDKLQSTPAAVFGVVGTGEAGTVWLLATDAIRGHALSIVLQAPLWLDHIARHYPAGLQSLADKRNALHIRWCQVTGFTLGATVEVNGHPFKHIHRPQGATRLV